MKRALVLLAAMVSLLAGCASSVTPDVASTIQVAVAATLTAQPTETPVPTGTETPAPPTTPHIAATVGAAIAGTQTAWPTGSSLPTPTEAPTATPTRDPVSTVPAVPIPTAAPFAHTLETHQGPGFSFQYPAGARIKGVTPGKDAWQRVVLARDEIHVIGPQVRVSSGAVGGFSLQPSYELTVRTCENPDGLAAEAWARAYIHASWQEAVARKRPWGSLPISETGEIDERKVEHVVVADQPGFLVWYYSFDSSKPAY
jgi:hypothetical protein